MKGFKSIEIEEKDTYSVNFLYKNFLGRCILKILILPSISKFFGFVMDSRVSKIFISSFVKNNKIDLSEYKETEYKSFNDFFKREVKNEKRPFSKNENEIFSPCDGKLTSYKITKNSVFKIKNSIYNLETLLEDKNLATEFSEGICLIFRLTPDNYHRYHFVDDGRVLFSKKIKGVLHTVRPIAVNEFDVYSQNAREYTLLETKNFGKIIQMEVGALFVGRIKNYELEEFERGQEKGMFEFGGSTIVMLIKKDKVKVLDEILENTKNCRETIVKMGEKIGIKLV